MKIREVATAIGVDPGYVRRERVALPTGLWFAYNVWEGEVGCAGYLIREGGGVTNLDFGEGPANVVPLSSSLKRAEARQGDIVAVRFYGECARVFRLTAEDMEVIAAAKDPYDEEV